MLDFRKLPLDMISSHLTQLTAFEYDWFVSRRELASLIDDYH